MLLSWGNFVLCAGTLQPVSRGCHRLSLMVCITNSTNCSNYRQEMLLGRDASTLLSNMLQYTLLIN